MPPLLKIHFRLGRFLGLEVLLALCFLILSYRACQGDENRSDWFAKNCPLLEKIQVKQFASTGQTRAQVIEKINRALHESSPQTKIEILFVPPDASLGISEAKYARQIHIKVHNVPVTELLRYMAMFDIEWKVMGDKIVGTQERTD